MKPIRFPILLLTFGFLAASPSPAAELQQIVLDDGSTLIAEVQSLEGGVYLLESPSLGAIRIAQKRVQHIRPRPAGPSALTPPGSGIHATEVRELQVQWLADPAMLSALLKLGELPEMRAVLSDPEILRAIESGDLGELETNPKIQQLMNNPALRDLTGSARDPGLARE